MKTNRLIHLPILFVFALAVLVSPEGQVAARTQASEARTGPARVLQQGTAQICYAIADAGGGPPGNDLLTQVDFDTGVETTIGSPGTSSMEAIAFQANTDVLFGADADQLGTLDLSTGAFTPLPNTFGVANGALGPIDIDDVDGLAFDPADGTLFGSNRRRRPTEDVLIKIDPATGLVVANGFGPGVGYVLIPKVVDALPDIDDISVDPIDGQMYAISNSGGAGDRLVKIDKTTGATTDVGPLGVNDMEGLTFDTMGNIMGTTGKDGPAATNNRLYRIDKATGVAFFDTSKPLTAGSDYEGVDCLTEWPTAVEMVYFQVEEVAAPQVTLAWLLASEIDNFGFNLYRARENNLQKAEWIHFEPSSGGSGERLYTYTDTVPSLGGWWYWLADVNTSGYETFHSPISVNDPSLMVHIYLPLTIKPTQP